VSHYRWNLLPPLTDADIIAGSGLSPLLVQLLWNRGITSPGAMPVFLRSDASLLTDPFRLPGMEAAVTRLYRALLSGEKIGIFGDFDADGITATAVLVQGLTRLGTVTIPYIPHRQTEGHGLNHTGLKSLHEQGVSLVISVDCGITDIEEVHQAMEAGLDIIITDHHTPLDKIPEALAVINPKLPASNYGFTGLAGVGVAFKLLQALYANLGKTELLDSVIDLVAIGTVADMSPPVGENRYLIRRGLELINEAPRPGLRELIQQTRLEQGKLNADNIGWVLAPCLNAAGRLADALTGYRLLVTEDPHEAQELAIWLARKNIERQKLTTAAQALAKEKIMAKGIKPLLLTADHEYPPGIAGLVASRLTEEFYRPSIVVHTAGTISQASCRSIPEFDIIAALNSFSHLLSRYGGHAAAAGFTCPTQILPELEQGLVELAEEQLAGITLMPRLDIDMTLTLDQLGGDTYDITQQLAPFGIGNSVPVFLSRGVEVIERRTMGNSNEHLRFKFRQRGTVWDAVAFRLGNHENATAQKLDIVYNLEMDTWNGHRNLRLNIPDFIPAER